MKVLIVDDDIIDREAMKRAIMGGTIETIIFEANTVQAALDCIERHAFDVVLLDYNLPTSTGVELLVNLKSKSIDSSVAIVMVSVSTDDTVALKCIKAGAQDFLVKTEINSFRLQRAMVNAQARADLERNLLSSYQRTKILAEHDSLTGLTNRYFFDETLNRESHSHLRNNDRLALLLIDLDHFKFVNDNYGHDIGDQLLIEVTKRVKSVLRTNELLSRLGGDEFGITILNIPSPSAAIRVAQRILFQLNTPFQIENYNINITASIGISVFPNDSNNDKELLKFADIAMYRAKELGRNQFRFFENQMQNEFLSKYLLENKLKSAILEQQFFLEYQPLVCSQTTNIIGVEALIRLTIDNELIRPDLFIPIAEQSHLIFEIGEWVLKTSIEQLSIWKEKNTSPITMAVNLSSKQLADKDLPSIIEKYTNLYNVSPSLIDLELTETALLTDLEDTKKVIGELKKLGCKVSLDDFGTGYSSISHLHNFPIDTVKIDRTLMPSASKSLKIERLLSGLVELLKTINVNIVAEGIETEEDYFTCRSLKVNAIQGYFIHRPMSAKDIETFYFKKS